MKVGEVAVVGRPNAGKSTLVNALVGEKVAIVSDKPQTTRQRILGVARRKDLEIALVDTPGIHRPKYRMNAAMVREATDALGASDAILFVVDAAEARGAGDAYVAELARKANVPVVLAVNKVDLLKKERLMALLAELTADPAYRDFAEIVPVSALTGDNVERLLEVLARHLPEGDAAYPEDFLTATPERDWIGEVIREKLLERTRDEIPFAHAVVVESIRPGDGKDITVVTASIVVEREGQKGILVGKGGSMIRDIGKAAREELESELGRKLYLELTVRVQPDWRNDERFLSRLRGGEDPIRRPGS
jgi:GTP-binding protein Era